ncbi:MAG: hypothetical protein ACI4HZ_02045 [Ruminococcus sp.]
MKIIKITCIILCMSILLSIAMVGVSADTPTGGTSYSEEVIVSESETSETESTTVTTDTTSTEPSSTTETTQPATTQPITTQPTTQPTTVDPNVIREQKIQKACDRISDIYDLFKVGRFRSGKISKVKNLEKEFRAYLNGKEKFAKVTDKYKTVILAMRKNIINSYKASFSKSDRKNKLKLFAEVRKEYTAYSKNKNYKVNEIKAGYEKLLKSFQNTFIKGYDKTYKNNNMKKLSKCNNTITIAKKLTKITDLKKLIKKENKTVLYNNKKKYNSYISKINSLTKKYKKRMKSIADKEMHKYIEKYGYCQYILYYDTGRIAYTNGYDCWDNLGKKWKFE